MQVLNAYARYTPDSITFELPSGTTKTLPLECVKDTRPELNTCQWGPPSSPRKNVCAEPSTNFELYDLPLAETGKDGYLLKYAVDYRHAEGSFIDRGEFGFNTREVGQKLMNETLPDPRVSG